MVFLQGAARRESSAGMCLLLVELGAIELCLSKEIVDEIRDVLTRPVLRQKFSSLTDHLVNQFIESLERHAVVVHDVPRIFEYGRDPKDEAYINLALAAGATYLVSRDKDVLDLANPSNPKGERLRRMSAHLKILDPMTLLRDLEQA